jgi:hypothetical protein
MNFNERPERPVIDSLFDLRLLAKGLTDDAPDVVACRRTTVNAVRERESCMISKEGRGGWIVIETG